MQPAQEKRPILSRLLAPEKERGWAEIQDDLKSRNRHQEPSMFYALRDVQNTGLQVQDSGAVGMAYTTSAPATASMSYAASTFLGQR